MGYQHHGHLKTLRVIVIDQMIQQYPSSNKPRKTKMLSCHWNEPTSFANKTAPKCSVPLVLAFYLSTTLLEGARVWQPKGNGSTPLAGHKEWFTALGLPHDVWLGNVTQLHPLFGVAWACWKFLKAHLRWFTGSLGVPYNQQGCSPGIVWSIIWAN